MMDHVLVYGHPHIRTPIGAGILIFYYGTCVRFISELDITVMVLLNIDALRCSVFILDRVCVYSYCVCMIMIRTLILVEVK
jgi:hypothetical protein